MNHSAQHTASSATTPVTCRLPGPVLARIRDLLPTNATDDRYLTLPRVCRHWNAALCDNTESVSFTLVLDGRRPQLARYVHSLHADRARARHLVVRNIDASWFTSSYGPDAMHPTWLAQLLVHHAPALHTLVLERVEPLSVDAIAEFVTQVTHLVNPSRAGAQDKKQHSTGDKKTATNVHGLFPHLRSLSIVGLRNVDPRTLHAFLTALGAIATPASPATVTRLRLSNIDFALHPTLLAAILPPPAPDASATKPPSAAASSSTSAPHDPLPSYSDSQLAHATLLTHLDLSLNPDTLTDGLLATTVATSQAAMASLTSLSLAGCIQVSPRGLATLTPHTPWLAHLSLAGCPLMPADLPRLAHALRAVSPSLQSLDVTLAAAGTQGGAAADSPQWDARELTLALAGLHALRHFALAYTDDDALPCVCSGLQVPLPTVLAMVAKLRSLAITWRPGANHHGGIPCGLVRRIATHAILVTEHQLQVTLVCKNALRTDRMVYYDRASPVSGMLTVNASLRACAENKCLGEERGMPAVGTERNDRQHQAEGDYLVDNGFVAELNRAVRAEGGGRASVKVLLVTSEMMKD